jgi:hypothetical protein
MITAREPTLLYGPAFLYIKHKIYKFMNLFIWFCLWNDSTGIFSPIFPCAECSPEEAPALKEFYQSLYGPVIEGATIVFTEKNPAPFGD